MLNHKYCQLHYKHHDQYLNEIMSIVIITIIFIINNATADYVQVGIYTTWPFLQ